MNATQMGVIILLDIAFGIMLVSASFGPRDSSSNVDLERSVKWLEEILLEERILRYIQLLENENSNTEEEESQLLDKQMQKSYVSNERKEKGRLSLEEIRNLQSFLDTNKRKKLDGRYCPWCGWASKIVKENDDTTTTTKKPKGNKGKGKG